MSATLPDWFAADQVFNTEDGWFVGVTDGFRIGPFAQQTQAQQHSRDLSAHLLRCRNTAERVRVVRRFVFDQIHEHGRRVRSSLAPREPAATNAGETPVRAGETPVRAGETPVRAGETPKVWFRSNRVYAVGEVWFFSTREGIDIGPYASRDHAERDLECVIEILRRSRDPNRNRAAIQRFKDGLEPSGGA